MQTNLSIDMAIPMQKIESLDRVMAISPRKHELELTIPGVRVFNLTEGEGVPEGTYQDPTVHTVICNRVLSRGGSATTILHRRNEDPQVRDWVDPYTFNTIKREVSTWDISYRRHPCELYPDGTSSSFSCTIPTHQ
jgi:hypothetical protein